jgi:hypothetical protein
MNNKIYPFKFLDSYTAEDKDIFFGRDEEIDQLYQMIYQSDILLLYGASGTGKTSLIQCGLASKFQKHDWLEVFVRRHKNLNESLQKSLITIGGKNEESKAESEDLNWLNDLMGGGEETTLAAKKESETQVFLKNIYLKHFRPIYLIFDQFEELFILGSKEEQAQFIRTVQEILKVEQPVKLIFSIREEYLGSLYEFERAVPELFRKKLRIDPMNLEKVKDVVLGATSSKKSIVHINEGEAGAIAEKVFEKIRGKEKTLTIQLPYLQVFLDKFYRHISKDKSKKPTIEATFSLSALSEIGDIGDILRDFLDEQIVEIAKDQKCDRKTIWKILSPFVTIDGTKEPIGIDTLDQNFPKIKKSLIEHVVIALMNNRILRYIEEEELYEIAHDSLALRIAEKRSDDEIALLEVRNLIKSQSLLKDEARELFSEKQLDFISPFLKRLKLNSEETKLIEESKKEVIHIQKETLRKKRRTQIFVSAFIFILLILLGFSWFQTIKAYSATESALVAKKLAHKAKVEAIQSLNKAETATVEADKAKKSALMSLKRAESANLEAEKAKMEAIKNLSQAQRAKIEADKAKKKAIYSLNEATFNDISKLSLDLKTYEKIEYNEAIQEKIEAINQKILDLNPISIDAKKTKELIKSLEGNPSFKASIDVLKANSRN